MKFDKGLAYNDELMASNMFRKMIKLINRISL